MGPRSRSPLSVAQRSVWLADRVHQRDARYNVPVVLRVVGRLSLTAVEAAVNDVAARHSALRSVVQIVDGVPHQEVLDADIPFTVRRIDYEAAVAAEIVTPFDIAGQVPLRVLVNEVA